MDEMIECGKIVGLHGLKGELKLEPWCDLELFTWVSTIYIDARPYAINSHRPHKNHVLLMLEDIDTPEKAHALRSFVAYVLRRDVNLPKGRYFLRDIYGFEVFDLRTNRIIGKILNVGETPAHRLYLIGPKGEIMIPAVPEFDKGVDMQNKRLTVKTIFGMLPDEN